MILKKTPFKLPGIAALVVLLLTVIFSPVRAQTDSVVVSNKDSTWHDWNLRIAPYVWLLGIKGQIAIDPDPVQLPELPIPPEQLPSGYSVYEIDLSFQEIVNSLKFALMLSGQYHFNRIVTQFNVSSLVLESDGITKWDYIFQNNTVRLAYAGGDLGIGYRVVPREKFKMDLLLGLKFVYFKVGLTTDLIGQKPVSAELSNFWGEPVLGMNISYRPLRWLELLGYGDVGPTLYNNKWTYQYVTSANFLITKHFYMTAGYRNYYVEGPIQEMSFTGTLSGMLIKFGFQF